VAASTLTPAAASALDPGRATDQYIHDRWQSENGFPGGAVHAIVQSSDGYLWIAAEKGLVRFDGVTFRLFVPPGTTSTRDTPVVSLVADAGEGIWAQLRSAALIRVRRNMLEDLPPDVAASGRVVSAMASRSDGTTFFAWPTAGVLAYRAGRLDTIVPSAALPSTYVVAMACARDGDLWLGTRDAGLLRLHDGRVVTILDGLPDQKIDSLFPTDHDLWIGTDHGIVRWNGVEVTSDGVPETLRRVVAVRMILDRDSNMWIASAAGELLRANRGGVSMFHSADRDAVRVTAVFEDREGSIWVGTTRGIERLRDGVFVSYSTVQGLPAGGFGPVYPAADRVWVAPADGGVYSIQGTRVSNVAVPGLAKDVVYSISGGAGGVWLGRQHGGLTWLRPTGADTFAARTFTRADGLAQDSVYAVHVARDGSVWTGTLSGGVSWLKGGNVTTFTTRDGLASNTVSAVLEAANNSIWLATPGGVSTYANGVWRRYTIDDGLPSNDVKTLFEDSEHAIWVGTAAGLALIRGGRVQTAFSAPAPLRSPIYGMAEDAMGSLWIATADRVWSVPRDRLKHQASDVRLRDYGIADGLLGVDGVSRERSVIADAAGRIWLSTNSSVSMVDPRRAIAHPVAAIAQIEEISADGTVIRLDPGAKIPARRQRVAFGYTGLGLATPERLKFRYRLDGFDRAWSEPSTARQAVYTNLGPGDYKFRVKASNGDGEWDGKEAAVAFSIAFAFWQTAQFRLLSAFLLAAAGWGAYRLRVVQVTKRLNLRFEDRLAERTRIAQELHDTLLQGFVSASMQLHVAVDRLPENSPAKSPLGRVLELMRAVIDEGRNAVRGLRASSTEPRDLERAFAGILAELGMDGAVEYRVIIEGQPRPLKPIIRDEIYWIGREAVVNACRHAEAKRIELEFEYAANGLRVLVRDDGRGIDEDVQRSGRDGHWGLPGMRERAARIGAKFRVWSRAAAGTEVELAVPGAVVFAEETER
jgi:signal transduction histidine kinase